MRLYTDMGATRFPSPVLGNGAEKLYTKLYGEEAGKKFMSILDRSPLEIAVVSRLIAYRTEKRGGTNGSAEDSQ